MGSADALILVVDDDVSSRELLQALLESEGYAVEAVADGSAGQARIEAGAIDLALLDQNLPDQDGAELCRSVRSFETETRVPIIMLTGASGGVQNYADFGADDYLAKPFDIDELLDRVQTHLKGD